MDSNTPHPIRRWIISILVVAILGGAGYFYFEHQKLYPNTDDAYLHGDIIYIAPQVGGRISLVNVENYDFVHEGELLFQIDPASYQSQLNKAEAAYRLATQQNKADSQAILAASSEITSATAELRKTQLNYRRTMAMVSEGVLPAQDGDNARAGLATARDNLASAKAHMAQLVAEQGAAGSAAPAVQEAAAALMMASLNVSYTNIPAPVSGQIGKVSVHPGSMVAIGQAMVPLVVDNSIWVQANYKESDLSRIKTGMTASVQLDMYPDKTFKGTVDSISPASGSSFSLLPPENATGNWVKITQRFPVSIILSHNDGLYGKYPLRVGASATVTVDTVSGDKK